MSLPEHSILSKQTAKPTQIHRIGRQILLCGKKNLNLRLYFVYHKGQKDFCWENMQANHKIPKGQEKA